MLARRINGTCFANDMRNEVDRLFGGVFDVLLVMVALHHLPERHAFTTLRTQFGVGRYLAPIGSLETFCNRSNGFASPFRNLGSILATYGALLRLEALAFGIDKVAIIGLLFFGEVSQLRGV